MVSQRIRRRRAAGRASHAWRWGGLVNMTRIAGRADVSLNRPYRYTAAR
jgi:hypothetical protein